MHQLILELAPAPAPTLENFFPGSNAAALGAVREAAAGRERAIYLWGEPGSGKSHLLQGFVEAARAAGHAAAFARGPGLDAPEGLDALAVDDVEKLDEPGQAALFDRYNTMLPRAGVVVAAGDRPASGLPLREDLRTRVASGIALQLRPLADADKRAALLAHARGRGMPIGEDVVDYLLRHCARDMGTQMAVVEALDRYALRSKRAISLPLLREALKEMQP